LQLPLIQVGIWDLFFGISITIVIDFFHCSCH
jgi:hypothetical protein